MKKSFFKILVASTECKGLQTGPRGDGAWYSSGY